MDLKADLNMFVFKLPKTFVVSSKLCLGGSAHI